MPVLTACLDCGALSTRLTRCTPCARARGRVKIRPYNHPEYLAQPMYGVCWMCGGPADTRDHIVPLELDRASVATRPACRSCNSARRHQRVLTDLLTLTSDPPTVGG